jgi:hypothetical protein
LDKEKYKAGKNRQQERINYGTDGYIRANAYFKGREGRRE